MRSTRRMILWILAVTLAAGCASTKVLERQQVATGKLPRPNHIWVYDFVASPADVPPDSSLAGKYSEHRAPQTPAAIAAGRAVGARVAGYLVEDLQAMGLPAVQASLSTRPEVDDIVLRGYLLSVDKGSAVERVVVGFGEGASELTVAVEGYQVTDRGWRRLGSGDVQSGGSKGPGAAVPAAVAIATANPIGLAVSGGIKAYGELSGSSTIVGREKAAAQEIVDQMRPRLEQQGWVY